LITTNIIKKEEGFRTAPYYCSLGYPTVGYGFKIGDQHDPLPKFLLPKPVAEVWLSHEIQEVEARLEPFLIGLNEVRRAVLVSMAFQMGIQGLFKFKKMWSAIANKDYDTASLEMLDSSWAKQTPERANRHADMMKHGKLLEGYLG
jgi:lysozyme